LLEKEELALQKKPMISGLHYGKLLKKMAELFGEPIENSKKRQRRLIQNPIKSQRQLSQLRKI